MNDEDEVVNDDFDTNVTVSNPGELTHLTQNLIQPIGRVKLQKHIILSDLKTIIVISSIHYNGMG